jgi:hypothetical protein
MRTIEMKFNKKTGEVIIEAFGFKGQSCKEATDFLKSLGTTTDFQQKAEWYEANLKAVGECNSNFCG